MSAISVIIPIFGRVELLEACLDSFERATCKPFEIIIVDDGNEPRVAAEICAIADKHKVHALRLETNAGAPAARNAGARIATGELLFFADADVVMTTAGLEYLNKALEKSPAAFAYGDFNFGKIAMKGKEFSVDELKKRNYISTMSLVRRSAFPSFDETLKRFQDWDLWLSIAERGGVGVYVAEKIYTAMPNGTISTWIPSPVIRNAEFFMWLPRVRAYMQARAIILQKHSR